MILCLGDVGGSWRTCSLNFWKQGPCIVHSVNILNDNCRGKAFRLSNFEKKDSKLLFETTFWNIIYILCFSLGKWCIRIIFERYFGAAKQIWKPRTIYCAFWGYLKRCAWSLSCWKNNESKDAKMVHSGALWNDVLEVGTAEKKGERIDA